MRGPEGAPVQQCAGATRRMAWLDAPVEDLALERLGAFRGELYGCFTARADALFELGDGAPRGAVVPDGGERPSISLPS